MLGDWCIGVVDGDGLVGVGTADDVREVRDGEELEAAVLMRAMEEAARAALETVSMFGK